jgi:hypothetical protein
MAPKPFYPTKAMRNRVILAVCDGVPEDEIAATIGCSRKTLRAHFGNELRHGRLFRGGGRDEAKKPTADTRDWTGAADCIMRRTPAQFEGRDLATKDAMRAFVRELKQAAKFAGNYSAVREVLHMYGRDSLVSLVVDGKSLPPMVQKEMDWMTGRVTAPGEPPDFWEELATDRWETVT